MGYKTLPTVEKSWLWRLVMCHDPCINFPSRKALVQEHILAMLEHTMDMYVRPTIASCATAIITFDHWMSRCGYNTLLHGCEIYWWVFFLTPRHVTIGLFEVADTTSAALAKSVKPLLKSFGLINKILAYVKDEGANLNTLAITLRSVVSCKPLQFDQPYSYQII